MSLTIFPRVDTLMLSVSDNDERDLLELDKERKDERRRTLSSTTGASNVTAPA